MYLLIVYVVSFDYKLSTIQQPASSLEVCEKAGQLISNDVKQHVKEVSFRCLPSGWDKGGAYLQ